jgi:hypothetical protein
VDSSKVLKTTETAMEEQRQRVAFQTDAVGEKTPLFRASLSTASLQDFSESQELRKSRWNTDYGTPKTTYWSTDYGAPMTTHHHFERKVPTLPRVRSRSLGAEVEATLDDKGLLLPALELGRVDISAGGTKDEPPSTLGTTQPVSRRADGEEDENPAWISIMYGMINATIILPVLMSFGSIIYRDQAFSPYMPVLVKMTVVSGVAHQLCFSAFSSLPFAVGQVQDAGLIFLSQMASRMVDHCKSRGYDDETMLATVTVGLSLSTALLGFCLVLLGQLRLAQYVQLLPTW